MNGSPAAQIFDPSLHAIGFEYDTISSEKVSGHFIVTLNCCQALKKLHGGVSAMIAEGLARFGAFHAAGRQRVVGFQLSINHLENAELGDTVYAEAIPISVGKTIQVWEVRLWIYEPSVTENKSLVAFSRVTVMSDLSLLEFSMNDLERVSKL